MQLEPRTIWVSLLVGTLVTVVAALVPARRATKVLPVEALREATPGLPTAVEEARWSSASSPSPAAWRRCSTRSTATAARSCFGLGLLDRADRRHHRRSAWPSVRWRRLIGCAAAAAWAARVSWRGRTRCATRVVRASTAAALMIGLTLVVEHGRLRVVAEGVVRRRDRRPTNADLYLDPASTQAARASAPTVIKAVAAVPGVDAGVGPRLGPGQLRRQRDSTYSLARPGHRRGADGPRPVRRARWPTWAPTASWWRRRRPTASHLTVGATVPAEFAATGKHDLKVAGIFDQNGWLRRRHLPAQPGRSGRTGRCRSWTPRRSCCWTRAPTSARCRSRITTALADHPDAKILDPEGVREGGERLHRPAAQLRHGDAAARGRSSRCSAS